jgi:hypothetical protein
MGIVEECGISLQCWKEFSRWCGADEGLGGLESISAYLKASLNIFGRAIEI